MTQVVAGEVQLVRWKLRRRSTGSVVDRSDRPPPGRDPPTAPSSFNTGIDDERCPHLPQTARRPPRSMATTKANVKAENSAEDDRTDEDES